MLQHDGGVSGEQVFADDFERRLLGNSWKFASGQWSLRDGVLVGKDPSFLAFAEKVPPPVRIEYDVRSEDPNDLSCFWLSNPASMGSGCLFAFASGEHGQPHRGGRQHRGQLGFAAGQGGARPLVSRHRPGAAQGKGAS